MLLISIHLSYVIQFFFSILVYFVGIVSYFKNILYVSLIFQKNIYSWNSITQTLMEQRICSGYGVLPVMEVLIKEDSDWWNWLYLFTFCSYLSYGVSIMDSILLFYIKTNCCWCVIELLISKYFDVYVFFYIIKVHFLPVNVVPLI